MRKKFYGLLEEKAQETVFDPETTEKTQALFIVKQKRADEEEEDENHTGRLHEREADL